MAEAKQIEFLLAGVRHPLTDEPLNAGAVWAYAAGTSTPKALYTARDTTEGEATNPVILDAYGKAEVFGSGVYKLVIRASDDESGTILQEIDGLEFSPVVADTGLGALTADLDFNGFKGINLVAGAAPGDTVEWQQFDTTISGLETDIDDVQTNLDAKTFVSLTDVATDIPALTGKAKQLIRINTDADGLEAVLTNTALAEGSILSLSDVDETSMTGEEGKALVVNALGTKVEFGYSDSKTIQGVDVATTAPADEEILTYDAATTAWTPKALSSLIGGGQLGGGLVFNTTHITLMGEGLYLFNGDTQVSKAPVSFNTFDAAYYLVWDKAFTVNILLGGNGYVGPSNSAPYFTTKKDTNTSSPATLTVDGTPGVSMHRILCDKLINPAGWAYGQVFAVFFVQPSA
jgi:hypothetical protein